MSSFVVSRTAGIDDGAQSFQRRVPATYDRPPRLAAGGGGGLGSVVAPLKLTRLVECEEAQTKDNQWVLFT